MDNNEVIAKTRAYVMHTYARQPLTLVRGKGSRVWDSEGREYLDFVTGIAVNSIGHCHPRVVETITEAAANLLHCSNLYHIAPQAELAEKLCRLSGLGKAFFCNSGAEANEAAIKLARRHAKDQGGADKFEIITAEKSFHGRTLATVTATGQAKYHQGFEPLVPGFRYVPLNDIAALEAAIGPRTAAVMLEPIQAEGGVHPCTPQYLKRVRELCDEYQALLILDEVQTGIGRTGKWFGFQHFSVRPDIITLAKALGGGLPIGCMLATDDAAQAFQPGAHASTFGGGPLVTRVALTVLSVIEEEEMLDKALATGEYLKEQLAALAAEYPHALGEVRGAGCLIGVDLRIDGPSLVEKAIRRGLLLNVAAGSVLRLLPPLNVERADVDEALRILHAVIGESV